MITKWRLALSLVVTMAASIFAAGSALAQAGDWRFYGPAFEDVLTGDRDLTSGVYCIALAESGYTPTQATDDTWSDVSTNEASGTGYTAGGTATTLSWSRSGLVVTLDATDVSWEDSTVTAKYAVIVAAVDAGSCASLDGTDPVIMFSNLDTGGGSLSTTAGTFSVAINAAGLMVFTAGSSD